MDIYTYFYYWIYTWEVTIK